MTWTQAEPFGDISIAAGCADRAARGDLDLAHRVGRAGDCRARAMTELDAHRRGAAVPLAGSGRASTISRRRPAARADELAAALAELDREYAPGARGLQLKRVAGGIALATDPVAEEAARRLLAKPRTPPLTPHRPRRSRSSPTCSRSRGRRSPASAASPPSRRARRSRSAASSRRLGGRSSARCCTARRDLFLKLFGLDSLNALPSVAEWDPSPEEQADLRDRLLRAGEQRAAELAPRAAVLGAQAPAVAASWPQAAAMSRPRVRRTVARRPCSSSTARNASIAGALEPS